MGLPQTVVYCLRCVSEYGYGFEIAGLKMGMESDTEIVSLSRVRMIGRTSIKE